MKKLYRILILLIICMCTCLGCSCSRNPSISFVESEIVVNVGNIYKIRSEYINISNSKSDYEMIVLDESIATLDSYTIIPFKKGETILRFQLKDNNKYKFDVKLVVTHIVYATSASVPQSHVVLNVNDKNNCFNTITLNDNCNEVPDVSYSRSIIDFDYTTGLITAKKVGQTRVVVLYDNVNVSFVVDVIDKIYTKQIEMKTRELFVGSIGKFEVSIFPDNANTHTFKSLNPGLIRVQSDGNYEVLQVGNASILCEYEVNDTEVLSKVFDLVIHEKVDNISFEVENLDKSSCIYYLLEKQYRLRISGVDEIHKNNLKFSSNINVSELNSDAEGLFADFYFKEAGNQNVTVEVYIDDDNRASETNNLHVSSIKEAEVKARWSAYDICTNPSNQAYHVVLDAQSGQVGYINFSLVLGEYVIREIYKVYLDDGENQLEISSMFTPAEKGEFDIVFKYLDVEINRVKVIVE